MRVLVIGGTRFIGAHLVRHLHADGAKVTVFHRGLTESPILPDVEHVRDPGARYPVTAFPRVLLRDWDAVVHMVGMGAADAAAAVAAFSGRARRLVLVSSCDVYRAYGRLMRTEPGPPDLAPLLETSPLRTLAYPYRGMEAQLGEWASDYDKILAENAVRAARDCEWTIVRLPKVYGPQDNADLASVRDFAAVPGWRWTHGHVVNVAAAIAAATGHIRAANDVFNIGEAFTPTMGERLARLPARGGPPPDPPPFDFSQPLAMNTGKLRAVLGYADILDEDTAMGEVAAAGPG